MSKEKNIMPYIAGVLYATIFGFSFLVTKNAFDYINPFHFLGLRFTMASLVMTILIALKVIKVDFSGKSIKYAIYLGLMEPFLYMICESLSIKMISSSQVGMMIAVIPIFVTIFSVTFLKEYVTKKQVISVVLSVAGVFFIIIFESGFGIGGNIIGYVLAMGAVIVAAGYTVYSRKLSTDFTPFELTYVIVTVGAVLFTIIGFTMEWRLGEAHNYLKPLLNPNVLLPLLYLSILSSLVAFALMNYSLSKISATRTGVFSNLTTIVSIIAGVIFRGEAFHWYHLVGGVMILIGVWGVNRYTAKVEDLEEAYAMDS